MRSREVARRYAEALFQLGRDEERLAEIERGYLELLEGIEAVPDAARFLDHPLVPAEAKAKTVDQVFPDLPPEVRNLVHLLIRNRRTGYMGLIYEEFERARTEGEGATRVVVATARALGAEERTHLSVHLARALGRRVHLDERVEPGLLGGVRIEVGDRILDATLRAQLEGLRASLAS